jgi:hypothetical protein
MLNILYIIPTSARTNYDALDGSVKAQFSATLWGQTDNDMNLGLSGSVFTEGAVKVRPLDKY